MTLSEYKATFDSCERIGKGGQKLVYRAKKMGHEYALKIITTSDDPRIQQEIEILKSLGLPNVPRILGVGTVQDDISHDALLCILEEYIDGRSLREELRARGTISCTMGCSILETLLDIEMSLEDKSILHRDIKPDNVMIRNDGKIFLIDFGIAKILGCTSLTRTALPNGPCTPAYAPRELAGNMKRLQDVRTDLYQIGLTVYEALGGVNPFSIGAKNKTEMLTRGSTIIPPALQIPGDTKGLLMQYLSMLMSKNQSQRPSSAREARRYYDAVYPTLSLGGAV